MFEKNFGQFFLYHVSYKMYRISYKISKRISKIGLFTKYYIDIFIQFYKDLHNNGNYAVITLFQPPPPYIRHQRVQRLQGLA